MKSLVFPDIATACNAVVKEIFALAESSELFQIALPTGRTMIPFYAHFSEACSTRDISDWTFYPVDEYLNVDETDTRSFHFFLNQHFFNVLKKQVRRLNWKQDEAEIKTNLQRHPLDCIILGIGLNGHLAFNEPGSQSTDSIRIVQLSPQTLISNFGSNPNPSPPREAITLGMREILQAKNVFVLAFGQNKADIVAKTIQQAPNSEVPSSFLKLHPNAVLVLDTDAASLLQTKQC